MLLESVKKIGNSKTNYHGQRVSDSNRNLP